MMGLEVDPDFSVNGYVYVCMASDAGEDNDVRVVRYELETPKGDAMVNRTDIVTGMPHNDGSRGRHSGCRPRFGPNGDLWVGTGDAAIEMAWPRPAIPATVSGFQRGIGTSRASRFVLGTTSGCPLSTAHRSTTSSICWSPATSDGTRGPDPATTNRVR